MADTQSLKLKHPFPSLNECPTVSLIKKVLCKDWQAEQATVFEIKDTINAVDISVAELAGHTTELSKDYFELLEKIMPDTRHKYAVIKRYGRPVLFTYFQLFTLTPENFNLRSDSTFTRTIIKLFTTLKKSKILMLGNALHNEKACYCYDNQVLTEEEAIEAVAALGEKIGASECVSALILKEIPELSANTQKLFKENGYIHPFDDNVMEMPIDKSWQNIDDYFKALSRKYKARANKIRASLAGIVVKTLNEAEIKHYEKDLHTLFSTIVTQQPFTLTHPAEGFFSGLKELYKDKFEVVGYFKEDKLIGFYSAFSEDKVYNIYYVGLDYTENETHQLYFNILFAGLEQAILQGKQLLQLGRTSFDAKASLGAQARPLNYLMRMEHIPDFILNRFVKYFASFENTRWKQRNPLK